MPESKPGWPIPAVFAAAAVVLIIGAAGGAWGSDHAVVAANLDRTGAAPLYDAIAAVAAALPFGEPAFRLAVLGALLGAVTLAGVVATARAMLPRDPAAGVIAALLLAVTPAFRDAAGFADPQILAAAGIAWVIAFACERAVLSALACCAIVIGSAPWLGLAMTVAIVAWLRVSRELVVAGLAGVGTIVCALWLDPIGGLPGAHGSTHALVEAAGRGAGLVVVGAGLLGTGFGAATRLPAARWLAIAVLIAIGHGAIVGGELAPLVLLAVGCAVIPGAVVRASGAARRHLVAIAGGVPLVAAAVITGAAVGVDDPGASPARVADDLLAAMPPGPGVFVVTHEATWLALDYAHEIAGSRPDLRVVPRTRTDTDVVVAAAIRSSRVAGADVAAFGRLDPSRATPRGRAFQLLGEPTPRVAPVAPPPRYASAIGHVVAIDLALARAHFEAAAGRLDLAARAAGLADRFGAANLAVLAGAVPTRAHPAFFDFVPWLDPPGDWVLDLLGDDLAWVAGLEGPPLPPDAPASRKLHARWRAIWQDQAKPDDPEIAALGSAAVEATKQMLAELKKG